MSGQNHLVEVLTTAQNSMGVATEEFPKLVFDALGQMLLNKARADVQEITEKAKADAKALNEQAEISAKDIEEKAKVMEQETLARVKAIQEKAQAEVEQAQKKAKEIEAGMAKAQSDLATESARQEKARKELAAEAGRQAKERMAMDKKASDLESDKASTASTFDTADNGSTYNGGYMQCHSYGGFGNGDLFTPTYNSWEPPMYSGGFHNGGFGNGGLFTAAGYQSTWEPEQDWKAESSW